MTDNERSLLVKYKIAKPTISRIVEFKKLIGDESFELIEMGSDTIDIPLDEEKFQLLMQTVLEEEPACGYANITFDDAEIIISFFSKPFAGRKLKQLTSSVSGMSSLFAKIDPEVMKTAMESTLSRKAKSTTTNV